MNKPRVSYEQAVRLKAVGYDAPTRQYFEDGYDEIIGTQDNRAIIWNKHDFCYSAPTLDDLANWLRVSHLLHVTVDLWQTDLTTEPIQHEWKSDIANMDDKEDAYNYTSGTYTEHDAAQSAAIDACLTILEKRKKTEQ